MALLSIFGVVIVWYILGYRIVREDENAVIVFLGRPRRMAPSGLTHTFWPLEYVRRFTTNLLQLDFQRAGIVTKEGKFEGKEYKEADIGVDFSLYFRWPKTFEKLRETLRIVGNPQDIASLTNLFEETVKDAGRATGGKKTYREINSDRKAFAQEVVATLVDEKEDPINQAQLDYIRLVIRHIEWPKELRDAITKPEIARLEKEAYITKKEGEQRGIELIGEGDAYAKERLFKAIGKEPENLQKEILLTLREMAKGTSNTILFSIPSRVTDVLEEIFGGKGKNMDIEKLSESQKTKLLSMLEVKK